jgi:hypothetical protein
MDDLKLVIVSRDGTVSVQASAERNVHAESVERNVAMNGHVHHPAMGRSSSDLVRRPVPRLAIAALVAPVVVVVF